MRTIGKRRRINHRDDAAQLRLIADNVPAMSIAFDEHLRCVFANRRFAEFFGFTTADIVGRHLREVTGEAAYQEVRGYFDQVLEGRRVTYGRTRLLASGERRHLAVELIPNVGRDGRVGGVFAVTTDVTEQKHAEELLRVANQQLQTLVQSSPVAIYTRDANGLLTSWNVAAEKMFGWRASEVLGKPLPTVPPEARADSEASRRRILAGEPFTRIESKRLRRDGSAIDVDAFNGPLRDGAGNVNGMITVAADVTERKKADDDLRRFRTAMDTSGDAILLIDRASMRYIDVNQTFCDLVGYTRQEMLGMTPMDLFSADRQTLERGYDALIADNNNSARVVQGWYRHKDGTLIPIEARRRALNTAHGWIIVGSSRDISERLRAEDSLRKSASELQLLIDNVPAMILYLDQSLHCVFSNRRYADFVGLAATDLVGKPLREIVGDAAYPALEAHFKKALEGHPVTYERNVRLGSGEQRCIEVKLVPRAGIGDMRGATRGDMGGFYSMAIDITEQKRAAERIEHLASHDSLTGLPNRLLFNDRLGRAISLARRDSLQFALLYLDLDEFKPVNDTLGHDAGDDLLKRVAERIRRQVRDSDTVARIGGDEFCVILNSISSPQDGAAVAEKIIAALAEPFLVGEGRHPVEVGTSIGIAVYPGDGQDNETLVKTADAAMYHAKERGNCFRFRQS